ncbi:Hypothetical predicted protein [Cloeon dipterum]|uniref:HIT-type domain-containing protein n=1 Tax=Cloeon dipterum TaxID=197152 RepID=A0A8S1CUJ0_9INSE|nr:Hypothetical predicted protein [Cloeon dipterum]
MESRLGMCEICTHTEAKYTCPGCEVSTCSVSCVKEHKNIYGCDGTRNKTAYVPAVNESVFRSDYGFLEEIANVVEGSHRLGSKIGFGYMPGNISMMMKHLRTAVHDRNMRLWFMPPEFTKRKMNRSFYNFKKKSIEWTVQTIFHSLDNDSHKVYEHKVVEKIPLKNCIEGMLAKEESTWAQFFVTSLSNCTVLLQAEYIKCAEKRFFLMDQEKSLQDNLNHHTLVEFPAFHVVPKALAANFKTITQDEAIEEIETRTKLERQKKEMKMPVDDESSGSESAPEVEAEPVRKIARLDIPEYKDICKIESDSDEDTISGNFFNL